jgi:hypothetical protein
MLQQWGKCSSEFPRALYVPSLLKDIKALTMNIFSIVGLEVHMEQAPLLPGEVGLNFSISITTGNFRATAIVETLPP